MNILRRLLNWNVIPDPGRQPPEVHPWRWRLLAIWIILFTAIAFWGMRTNRETARDGHQAHDAICVLKVDLRRRIHDSEKFLNNNPNGLPGISAQVISDSLEGQRRTLSALGPVRCDGATKR